MSDLPIWALVAHVPPEQLAGALDVGSDELPLEDWQIVGGSGGHSALLSYDLGSEGVDAELARMLSECDAPVYDVRLSEDLASVRLFENGAYARDVDEEPRHFLERHGVELERAAPQRAHSVLIVDGADPEETAAAVQLEPGDALQVEPVDGGTVVYGEAGDVSPLLRLVARNLPEKTIYLLSHLPGSHFVAQAVRGDEDLGVLYDPRGADPKLPSLGDVRGEHEAAKIARAFGVRPELLGLTEDE